jgi:transposase InsO family protein
MLNISRQAVYQQLDRDFDNVPDVESILALVRSIREKQPRIGARKLYSMLGEQLHNLGIGRDRFFDVLRTHQLLVKPRKKYTPTTNSRHEYPVHPNLLIHTPAQRPNEIWVADQTYLLLPKGFCYLSLVTDLWSRKIIGYCLYPTLEAIGPLRALSMALRNAPLGAPRMHHSDRGVQYSCTAYSTVLAEQGIIQSMSAAGCPYHNAVAERINGILKNEFYLDRIFGSLIQAERAVVEAIKIYNNLRPHLSLMMRTPDVAYAA